MILCGYDTMARLNYTVQDGVWSDVNIWYLAELPINGDSIIIYNRVELDMDLNLDQNYLKIEHAGFLCSPIYGISIGYESEVVNHGYLAVAYLNVIGGTLYNNGTIRTITFYVDTKNKETEVVNDGSIFVTNQLENACPKPPTPVDTITGEVPDQLPEDTLILCEGETPKLPYSKADYLWENGAQNGEFIPSKTKSYSVTITSKINETVTEDTVYIIVKPSLASVPNVFTPNGDGYNEQFLPDNFGLQNLTLYNRWGRKVFESDVLTPSSFEKTSDGVYFYVLEHNNECSDENPVKGWVTIMR